MNEDAPSYSLSPFSQACGSRRANLPTTNREGRSASCSSPVKRISLRGECLDECASHLLLSSSPFPPRHFIPAFPLKTSAPTFPFRAGNELALLWNVRDIFEFRIGIYTCDGKPNDFHLPTLVAIFTRLETRVVQKEIYIYVFKFIIPRRRKRRPVCRMIDTPRDWNEREFVFAVDQVLDETRIPVDLFNTRTTKLEVTNYIFDQLIIFYGNFMYSWRCIFRYLSDF